MNGENIAGSLPLRQNREKRRNTCSEADSQVQSKRKVYKRPFAYTTVPLGHSFMLSHVWKVW